MRRKVRMGATRRMRPMRFILIAVFTTVLLTMFSGYGGYLMGGDASEGLAIGERRVGVTTDVGNAKVSGEQKRNSAREGIWIGGALGLLEGLLVGVGIAWGDMYLYKKKMQEGKAKE